MEKKPTPGPWLQSNRASLTHNHWSRRWECAINRAGNLDYVGVAVGEDLDECVANAHLIASAPELLEALKRVVAAERAFIEDTNAAWDDEVGQAVIAAEAAIAKAEGR